MTVPTPAFPSSIPLMPAYIRARGALTVRFSPTPRGTRAAAFSETGGYRLKFPRAQGCEAMIVNTGGGIAGGDGLVIEAACETGAEATISTQSAEKIYRAQRDPARISVDLSIGPGAALAWLPQETILFDGARLERRVDIAMASDARLTLCEAVVCGRTAMGERMETGLLSDKWFVRRGGRLVFADCLRLDGAVASRLDRQAAGGGGHAFATILRIAPDAPAHVEPLRCALDGSGLDWGVSAWDGMLAVRFAATDASLLRRELVKVLSRFPDCAVPRIWAW
jgi:urease accessory protein